MTLKQDVAKMFACDFIRRRLGFTTGLIKSETTFRNRYKFTIHFSSFFFYKNYQYI